MERGHKARAFSYLWGLRGYFDPPYDTVQFFISLYGHEERGV